MSHSVSKSSKNWSAVDYVTGILQGDRVVLGRAITLLESTRPEHRELAEVILEKCLPYTGKSFRIGITGPPGAGKSSFIEALGSKITQVHGKKLAVLAIDPSSKLSGGSILGDKTRMERLSADPNAFIRPSPAGKSLGGVAKCTHETMLLCEAAGFDTIFIETVGVGQSETEVAGMVDCFLLLLLPGAGDELQGIKRGIVEMADLVVVNKADGERIDLAKRSKGDYEKALHLFPAKESNWQTEVLTCSALTGDGLDQIWQHLLDFQTCVKANGWFERNRHEQLKVLFHQQFQAMLQQRIFDQTYIAQTLKKLEQEVTSGQKTTSAAVEEIWKTIFPK